MIADRIIAALAAGTLSFALACGKYGPPVRNAKYRAAPRAESVEVRTQAEEEDDDPDAESIILGPAEAPDLPVP